MLTNRGVHGESSVLVEDVEFIFTENRKAAVGERVLITKTVSASGTYNVGDIFTVQTADEYGGIFVKEHLAFLIRPEYEVIIENKGDDEMKIDLNAMGYEELMAHGDAVMEAIKKRTFQEGFRAAKQVQRKLAKMNAEKSAQARRDEIVEQAKADVESRLFIRGIVESPFLPEPHRVEFIVNNEKRTVFALLINDTTGKLSDVKIAKAAPDDCFNVHIGKAIALRRALGLAVPEEYLNAPQPTEVRVGDVVYYSRLFPHLTVSERLATKRDGFVSVQTASRYVGDGVTKIIDDSREEVGE
ncbi:hypothetical protein [Bacillus subtilis]|uniref:hypothetical protein n=1 Tax=Bacillus subtilis TaxID=1423 RepID=UPI003CFB16A6